MTETKVLNPQTIVEEDKVERARRILFSPVDVEAEQVAQNDLDKFSNSYTADNLQKVIDEHDLNNYMGNIQTQTQTQVIPQTVQTKPVKTAYQEFIENQSINSVETERKVLSKPNIKAHSQVNAKLNFRGKLMLFAFSAVAVLLGFLSVYNAVDINNLNTEIEGLTTQVTKSESYLGDLWSTYSNLNNTNRVLEFASDQGMSSIANDNQITLELEIQETQIPQKSTNWFDVICNYIANLFK